MLSPDTFVGGALASVVLSLLVAWALAWRTQASYFENLETESDALHERLQPLMGYQPKGKIKGPPPRLTPPVRFNICEYCQTEYGVYGHCENCGAPVRNRQYRPPLTVDVIGDGIVRTIDVEPGIGGPFLR